MKKYSFLIATTFLFAACSAKVNRDSEDKTGTATETPTEQTAVKTATVKDPVCGMDKGDDWTEYSVSGTDTSWFCSPHCKETFAKNPEKYLKKKEETKG